MNTVFSIGKVWAVNGSAVAVITLAHVQGAVAIALGLVSIAYTLHKWRQDNKQNKDQ